MVKLDIDIALGEKINSIQKKLDGYSGRFLKEKGTFEKYILECKDHINREQNTLDDITNTGNKDPN